MIYVYSAHSTTKHIFTRLCNEVASKSFEDCERLVWAASEINPRTKPKFFMELIISKLIRNAVVLSDGNLGFGKAETSVFTDLQVVSEVSGFNVNSACLLTAVIIRHIKTRGDKPLSHQDILHELNRSSEIAEYYQSVIADKFLVSRENFALTKEARYVIEAIRQDRQVLLEGMETCASELTISFLHEQVLNQDEEILINLPWTAERLISEIYGMEGCNLSIGTFAQRELEFIATDISRRYFGGNLVMHAEGTAIYVERISPGWAGYIEHEKDCDDPSAIQLSREELIEIVRTQQRVNHLVSLSPELDHPVCKAVESGNQHIPGKKVLEDRKVIVIYPEKREERAAIHRYLTHLENSEEIERTTVV